MKSCSVENCNRPSHTRGLCQKHYMSERHKGRLPSTRQHTPGDMCTIEDCAEVIYAKGYCRSHYRQAQYKGLIPSEGVGYVHAKGYQLSSGGKAEHIVLAERALGRPLPLGVQVHHVNCSRSDNKTSWNLIICPDQAYHSLIERRGRALEACGNANFVKCQICKTWDDPSNDMYTNSGTKYHRSCMKEYREERYGS